MAETILNEIVAKRRHSIERLAENFDLSDLERQLEPSQRSLAAALSTPQAGFILECKKASPSKGLIRANYNAAQIAQAYRPYAAAISVLTEPDYFQGDFADLAAVSATVDIPVLCKDFIVTELQVLLARYYGADAVLLMLSVLTDDEYRALARLAADYQLDVLTEVSTAQEMQRAKLLNAKIIGINNRNLHDLSIDPQRSIELSQLAPPEALLVAESGFSSQQAVRTTAPYVNGFLVGSALTAQADIDRACRQLIFGEHKVCGLTKPVDAQLVRACGGYYGGLIFVPSSPRAVTLAQAQEICAAEAGLDYVAVVQNMALTELLELARQVPIAAIQLHGEESLAYVTELRASLPDSVAIWRAVAVTEPLSELSNSAISRYVLDNQHGGSGMPFNWDYLNPLTASQRQHALLAGGIGPELMSKALEMGFSGLDMNSKLERIRGQKDPVVIAKAFKLIRNYGRLSS
ncbi:bifunctional indole-3-glycerol-phosphate synthase TrpC/phosphoribosylanthranilate isomerase TrpF [Pseudidiomarina taiwanensis]|uniref:Multifunctional fusion protein n=1 Tax=Pseudidiomarina taiwanensis TaxID=337250 RepID=A0A432ZNV4_9GAMM|nr:bifunctional indole-3-glycerol-phosphate synthase TrpC/phosphoribosylanthranilate isomerase TrpF [Pseudidiomarina taiwanensis]RUO79541.1 bifunctional indole-3-glycerol-phosphate synthase TrpC/phosphoribosylanthranilate isomerase TrpF [Pseudidiomarina taiwanensis]